jgi:hypothetical protein
MAQASTVDGQRPSSIVAADRRWPSSFGVGRSALSLPIVVRRCRSWLGFVVVLVVAAHVAAHVAARCER